ncbi:MAG: sulfurtransferase TusA family protein [Thermoanaerobacteraceae bacterium]
MGEICPLPLIKAKHKLEEASKGDLIKIIVDHRCTLESIDNYFSKHDYIIEIKEVIQGVWEIYIKK